MVRLLAETDLGRIEELELALFGADAWSRSAYAAEIARADREWWGIQADGELVAYGGIMLAPQADLLSIAVAPKSQGRGFGRVLLRHLIGRARARGARELFLEVRVDNAIARALYAAEGFTEIGIRRRYYRGGIDAVVMVLALVPSVGPVGATPIT